MKLDSLLVAASLRFIAVDPDFRRQASTEERVSWGPPPARFAAAELVEIDLSDDQFAAMEKAAAGVRYKDSGETSDVSLAQFMAGATMRLLQRQGRAEYSGLKAELTPFLGPTVPPLAVLDATIGPARKKAPAPPASSKRAIAHEGDGPSHSVILSPSMQHLPRVASAPRRPARDETVGPAHKKGPVPAASGNQACANGGPTALMVSVSLQSLPRVSSAPPPPARSTTNASSPSLRGLPPGRRDAAAAPSLEERPERDSRGKREKRAELKVPVEEAAEDELDRAPAVAPPSLGFDLRVGVGIGGVLLLTIIVTAAWASSNRKQHADPPLPDDPAALATSPDEPGDLPVAAATSPDEPGDLPGALSTGTRGRPAEDPNNFPEPIGRPTLPPPPDTPEPPSSSPDVVAASKALKELTLEFHKQGSPTEDIDARLRTVDGRPRVGSDGRIVQSDQVSPEHRYDVFIRRAADSVAPVYAVPIALVKAVIKRESNFNPEARSGVGAVGLMQVMPFNAAKVNLSVADLSEPEKNILAGTRLLAVLLKYYDGDITNALVAYNAKARPLFAPIPRNGETPGYVAAVLHYLKEFSDSPALNSPR